MKIILFITLVAVATTSLEGRPLQESPSENHLFKRSPSFKSAAKSALFKATTEVILKKITSVTSAANFGRKKREVPYLPEFLNKTEFWDQFFVLGHQGEIINLLVTVEELGMMRPFIKAFGEEKDLHNYESSYKLNGYVMNNVQASASVPEMLYQLYPKHPKVVMQLIESSLKWQSFEDFIQTWLPTASSDLKTKCSFYYSKTAPVPRLMRLKRNANKFKLPGLSPKPPGVRRVCQFVKPPVKPIPKTTPKRILPRTLPKPFQQFPKTTPKPIISRPIKLISKK